MVLLLPLLMLALRDASRLFISHSTYLKATAMLLDSLVSLCALH